MLRLALLFAAALVAAPAAAQFPAGGQPVTMVVPYPPGGLADILARVAYHMGFDCVRGSTYRGGARAIGEVNDKDLEQFPDLEQGDLIGKRGVELMYDNYLRGKDGAEYWEYDSHGRRLKEYEPAVRAVLVRNPEYFVAGQPYLEGVEFRMIKNDDARVNALRTGARCAPAAPRSPVPRCPCRTRRGSPRAASPRAEGGARGDIRTRGPALPLPRRRGGRAADQRVAERLDFGRDRLEKTGSLLGRPPAVVGERVSRGFDRPRRFGSGRFVEHRLQRFARRRVARAEACAADVGEVQEAENVQAVVHGDDDHVFLLREVRAVVKQVVAGACGKPAPVHPHHDRPRLVVERRREDVDRQAVFALRRQPVYRGHDRGRLLPAVAVECDDADRRRRGAGRGRPEDALGAGEVPCPLPWWQRLEEVDAGWQLWFGPIYLGLATRHGKKNELVFIKNLPVTQTETSP
mgnify:CR=1 FL=1